MHVAGWNGKKGEEWPIRRFRRTQKVLYAGKYMFALSSTVFGVGRGEARAETESSKSLIIRSLTCYMKEFVLS